MTPGERVAIDSRLDALAAEIAALSARLDMLENGAQPEGPRRLNQACSLARLSVPRGGERT